MLYQERLQMVSGLFDLTPFRDLKEMVLLLSYKKYVFQTYLLKHMPIPVKIIVMLMNSLRSISSKDGNSNLCKSSENFSFILQVLCCAFRKHKEITLRSQRKTKIITGIRTDGTHSLWNYGYCITNLEAVRARIVLLSVLSTALHGRDLCIPTTAQSFFRHN